MSFLISKFSTRVPHMFFVQELQRRVSAALLRRRLGRPVVPGRCGLRAAPAGRQQQLGLAHRGRKTQSLGDPVADVTG